MSLASKIMIMLAAALGVICTLGAIIQLREVISSSTKPSFLNAGIGLLFIALFIFAGLLIFIFVTLCCWYYFHAGRFDEYSCNTTDSRSLCWVSLKYN
ncbi:hypothetical protein EG68_12495 [Paragonimus skrjabini miyazakii]|uniref:Uncharacterized protein n=1 Tax=Paragonimus skrjabini miyazakii TaxID=59628 RepID=A0A8S9YCP7_9TREM|nr:hypothetical protein EG68_12495 [Paragonimus skrjabini miyazakii]